MHVCQFWSCDQPITSDHFLCREHYWDWDDENIDECPKCRAFKDVDYTLCRPCENGAPGRSDTRTYTPEWDRRWDAADKEGDWFHVYILKLADGRFYAGHTRNLRARMSEHRDGQTKATRGKRPKLQWFEGFPTRHEAADAEMEMKRLIDQNERYVRKLIIQFRDEVGELDFD